jgi:uncharacterized membrane protein YhaH (DUF805 family)
MNWYLEVLKKYTEFDGRARRKEYWYFTLFNFLAFFTLAFIDGVIGSFNAEAGIGLLAGIYSLGVLIPALAVSIRRLHDTNRSGWWLLIELIPVIGAIVLFIFMVQDSQQGDNQYGANPKPDNERGSNQAVVVAVAAIVVIVVIGIVAAIAIPAYQDYVERAKQAGVHQNQSL